MGPMTKKRSTQINEYLRTNASTGMTVAEMGANMNITPANVRSRLYRLGLNSTKELPRVHEIRRAVQDMPPTEAAEVLLMYLEDTVLNIEESPSHNLGVRFTDRERIILDMLFAKKGRVVPKWAIHERLCAEAEVRGNKAPESDKNVDVYLFRIREKLPEHLRVITHWGQGVELVAEEKEKCPHCGK